MSIFATELIFADVRAQLAADGLTANFVFGRREAPKQVNQGPGRANRVVFEPGKRGSLGAFAPPKYPGRAPRPLLTLKEAITVYCWAHDPSAPNDELVQYTAARDLLDSVLRAIYLSPNAGHGAFSVSDPYIVGDKIERVYSYELAFTLTVDAAILDEPARAQDAPSVNVVPTAAVGPAKLLKSDITTYEIDGTDTTPFPP